jgi:hypothetical protein
MSQPTVTPAPVPKFVVDTICRITELGFWIGKAPDTGDVTRLRCHQMTIKVLLRAYGHLGQQHDFP